MRVSGRCVEINGRDRDTGAVSFRFHDYGSESVIQAIGVMSTIEKNSPYVITGDFNQDGLFICSQIRRLAETMQDSVDILTFSIPGISEKIAEKIVEALGEDIFTYTDKEPEEIMKRLMGISGVGPAKAKMVCDFIRQGRDENDVFAYLSEHGVPYSSILQFLSKNGNARKKNIISDPYQLIRYDAPLEACEKIATENGMFPWDFKRIHAIIQVVMKRMSDNGNTRMEFKQLCRAVSRLSQKSGAKLQMIPDDLVEIVAFSAPYLKIYKEDGTEYASDLNAYRQESSIVRNLRRLTSARTEKDLDLPALIRETEEATGVSYNDEQREAFKAIRTGGVSILVGGPGTGKTTVINGIVKAYQSIAPKAKILLCAPTGRAAARMAEVSGHSAYTLHKSMDLKWFFKDASVDPLEYDLIIVDEMSMCDTELFSYFAGAAVSGCTIILTGDPEQIPSVGPGQVFRDLVDSGTIPTYRLTQIIRQKKGSIIVENAYAILEGKPLKAGPDFQIAVCKNDNALYNSIKNMKREELPQILCPVKGDIAGTKSLNLMEQKRRNWKDKGIWLDGTLFHKGDRVIMNSNNYEAGYMNGDIGVIQEVLDEGLRIDFPDKSLLLSVSALDGIGLAYALTFHKSQGAECGDILIVLPSKSAVMASRELLYTAVTRAKNKVWLAAAEGVLDQFVNGIKRTKRECGLFSMLIGNI